MYLREGFMLDQSGRVCAVLQRCDHITLLAKFVCFTFLLRKGGAPLWGTQALALAGV